MRALAGFRVALGVGAWLAPDLTGRIFGIPDERRTPELEYMNRVFGVRAVSLGLGYLGSNGDARSLWHRLWLLCDGADTAMGIGMLARGRLSPAQGIPALAITGGALAIDLVAIAITE